MSETSNIEQQQPESSAVNKTLKLLPLIQFIGSVLASIVVAVIATYSAISLTQDSTAREVERMKTKQEQTDRRISDLKEDGDKKIEEVKREILTKKEFEAYWKQIELLRADIKAVRDNQDKLLEK